MATKYIVNNKSDQTIDDWSFGATGMTFPDDSIQTTAYAPPYKVYTALLHPITNKKTHETLQGFFFK